MAIDERCKLFVAGLPDSISESVLRQLFEATGGTVVDVSVPRDRATGRPRGFGFVTLSSEDEARAARESLDGSMQSGRSISVRPFQAGPPKRPDGAGPGRSDAPPETRGNAEDRTLYLGNLPYDTSAVEVEQMLERAGVASVVRVNLPLDPQGRPRGFGFVIVRSPEDAQSAVDALREAELKGRRVSASIAHARGERPPRPSGPPIGGGGYGGGGGGGYGGGGGGGYASRPPMNEPRWAPAETPMEPAPGVPPEEGGEGKADGRRRGPKDTANKKKKGARGPERGRSRREGEGLRAKDWGKDDE